MLSSNHHEIFRERLCIVLALLVLGPLSARAQLASTEWRALGTFPATNSVTGAPDSTTKFVRHVGGDTYVLRTEFREDRVAASGTRWRNSYLTAAIDCRSRTMQLLRMDYYTARMVFIEVMDMQGVTVSQDIIRKTADWRALYNHACTLE